MVVTEGNSKKIVERCGEKKGSLLLLERLSSYIASHKASAGKIKPDVIVNFGQDVYHVKA